MIHLIKQGHKILGMNSRNLEYIRPLNLKRSRQIADDKLLSKRILKKNNLAIPKLIAKIENLNDLENFNWSSLPNSFALKPNRGFGGEGIIVVYGKKKGSEDVWIKADRSLITISDFKNHIRNILDGFYSLSNTPDTAFFEERLTLLKTFKPYTFRGIPDIRIIVFNKVPVMAMLRLPTKESGGKANLQQGAIGVGIDLATGTTTTSVLGKNKIVDYVPGTRLLLSGIKIPYWNEVMTLAVRCQEVSKLGFLGADIAIDKERGPVVVELNARPGLSIQVANLSGLKERLERVRGIKIKTLARGVRVGMDLFGGGVEESLEGLSGKKVIGTIEKVKLIGKNEKEIETEAKIDTGAGFTSIDMGLAKQLGFEEMLNKFEDLDINYERIKNLPQKEREALWKGVPDIADAAVIHSSHGTSYRPMVKIKIIMDGIEIFSKASVIDRSNLKFPIIIGKRNLGKFLIDINK